jgi:DNA-binding MarR family transcriptional regulator
LAKNTGKSSKAVSEAAKLLEALSYVTIKLAEDEPGRPKHVSLTTKGEAMCKSLAEASALDKKTHKASSEEG